MPEQAEHSSRSTWIYSLLLTIVGWIAMMTYAIPDYLNRVPPLTLPPEGISMGWVTFRDTRLRCAVATSEFQNAYRLKIDDGRASSEPRSEFEAFVSAGFSRRAFGVGPLPAHEKVRWGKFAIPIKGIISPPADWNDIDVWIIQTYFVAK